jgi:hypothetical protein
MGFGSFGGFGRDFGSFGRIIAAVQASAPKPFNTVLPAITGTAQEGQVLTVSDGAWTGAPTGFTYQWFANGVPIAGAINLTRIMTSAEIGKVVTCAVTATNQGGPTTAVSAGTAAVIAAPVPVPVNTVAPVVSGSNIVGSTLTATSGTWTNSPTSYTYQWRGNGVNIPGATASTYTIAAGDAFTTITCRVSAVNAGGEGAPAITNGIAAVPVPATFSRPTDQPLGILADHTYQCDSETGGLFGKGKASVSFPVTVTANGTIYVRLRDKSTGQTVGSVSNYPVTTATTSINFDIPGRLGWGYIDMSRDNTDWSTFAGGVAVGAGDQSLALGQSLGVRFSDQSDVALSSPSVGNLAADPNLPFCRTFVTNENNHPNDVTGIVWEMPGAGVHNKGAGSAKYLTALAAARGRNQSLASHCVSGTPQEFWQYVSGHQEYNQLVRVVNATGGKYRFVIYWQGHADAQCCIPARQFQNGLNFCLFGTGAAGGVAALNTFVDSQGRTSRNGSCNYLVATIPNVKYNVYNYFYGPMAAANEVRKGGMALCAANPGIATYVNMEGCSETDGVHPGNVGMVDAAVCFLRAALSDNLGPRVMAAQRDPANPNDILVTVSNSGTDLQLSGIPRFVVYIAGSTHNMWPLASWAKVDAHTVRLTLSTAVATPTLGDAFDVWLAPPYDGDLGIDPSGSMLRDNRTDSFDGVNGRTMQPNTAPATAAAINSGVPKTPNGSLPNPYIAPSSIYDIVMAGSTYAASEALAGFGLPLTGATSALTPKMNGDQESSTGNLTVGSGCGGTLAIRFRMPTAAPTGSSAFLWSWGAFAFTIDTAGKLRGIVNNATAISSSALTFGEVYWAAVTLMEDGTVYLHYARLTGAASGLGVVNRIATSTTQRYSKTNQQGGIPSPMIFATTTGASVFDVGFYGAAIYTAAAASTVIPTVPIASGDPNLLQAWSVTAAGESGGRQKNKVLLA